MCLSLAHYLTKLEFYMTDDWVTRIKIGNLMLWIKSGIENPSKSEVIGRCGGDEKKRMTMQNRQKVDR